MKKGKLLVLLAALLSVSLLFVACADPKEGDETDTTATSTDNEKPADMAISDATKQEIEKHEIQNYFDLVSEEEDVLLSGVSCIDGELISYDREHNLAVICKKGLDLYNRVTETWKVYDLTSDTVIHTESVTNPYKADDTQRTHLNVSIEYPVIRVVRRYGSEIAVASSQFEASYYFARSGNGEAIHTTNKEDFEIYEYQNGLVCVKMGDKMFWIDKNLEIIRSVETIFAGGYDVEAFSSEYQGYLYSWEDPNGEHNNTELLIFNRGGKVSGRYLAGKDSFIRVFVLNNGNALVQEFTTVSIYDAYDFVLNGTRYKVKSSIVDHVTGKTEQVDLGFVVSGMVTKYYQRRNDNTKFVLKDYDSYAYVYNYANGYIAKGASLCVLDNSLNKLYTLENDTYGVNLSFGPHAIRDDRYITMVESEGVPNLAMFDLNGNLICYVNPRLSFTDKYIVSDTTVYDYNMKPVFDIQKSGMTYLDVLDEAIYLSYNNFETGAVEYYVIRSDSKTPELLADGINYELWGELIGDGYYGLYDVKRDVYVIYNTDGEELITSYEPFINISNLNDVRLFETTFNGSRIVYVVK